MREYEITTNTALHLLLTGLRIRMQRTAAQVTRQLGLRPGRVAELEGDPQAAKNMPTGEFVELLAGLGVRLVVQAPWMTGPGIGLDPLVSDDPAPEPAPVPALIPEPTLVPTASGRPYIYMRDTNSLPDTLRALRLRTGKTSAQVCREMGIQQGTYSKHERDSVNISMDFLSAYADYFKVNFVIGVQDVDTAAA